MNALKKIFYLLSSFVLTWHFTEQAFCLEKLNSSVESVEVNLSDLMTSLHESKNLRFPMTYHQLHTFSEADTIEKHLEVNLPIKAIGGGVFGPQVHFSYKQKYTTLILAENEDQVFDHYGFIEDDNLDRYLAFQCVMSIEKAVVKSIPYGLEIFASEFYKKTGQFHFSSLEIKSSRVALPRVIDGKRVSLGLINEICHKKFPSFRNLDNGPSNSQRIQSMAKVILQKSIYVKPSGENTFCHTDNQCRNWFSGLVDFIKIKNTYRCIPLKGENFGVCRLRGEEFQHCPIYNHKGKRISGGFEYFCDEGLYCHQTQKQKWYQNAKGECRYKTP